MVRFAALNGTLQTRYYPRRLPLSAAKRTSPVFPGKRSAHQGYKIGTRQR